MSRDCCSDLTSVTGYSKIAPFFKRTANRVQFPKKNIHLYFFDVSFSQFTLVYDNFEENFGDKSKYRWSSIKCLPSNYKTVKVSFNMFELVSANVNPVYATRVRRFRQWRAE